ncbi:hypothetical protein CK203_046086 [Vitis vinifera]|uniref:DUF4283 domain-containing protein n=1 Tax=Vitis vinifera TaxID=29760 RepID=A0A438HP19_VITVI|nr:hypothetical protein CK203_046086 [Vitis vinifera]
MQVMSEGVGKKLRLGEISRLEGLECYWIGNENMEDGVVWVFTRVYGPFSREERECLWEEIRAIRGLWEEPWCFKGFENMWLKVEGFKDPIRCGGKGWWEVFGNLKRNKVEALQQVELWELSGKGEKNKDKWGAIIRGTRSEGRDCERYQQLLSNSLGWKADIRGLQLKHISQSEAEVLELPFSKSEIHAALMERNEDKAPGPRTGSRWLFGKAVRKFVKKEVFGHVQGVL